MKIGELVSKSGLSERMLRHYEKLGIVMPQRSDRGTRYYSDADLEVARLTHHFRELDIPLDTIAAIAQERRLHPTGDSSGQAIGSMLSALADNLAEKAEKSLALHKTIVDARKAVSACRGCKNRPSPQTCPDCPMGAATLENAVAAMIWRDE